MLWRRAQETLGPEYCSSLQSLSDTSKLLREWMDSAVAARRVTSVERNHDVVVSHDVTMTLSTVTLLTLLYISVVSASPGKFAGI